jgi:hypothetical protein
VGIDHPDNLASRDQSGLAASRRNGRRIGHRLSPVSPANLPRT